jgi:hypothetical protein
LPVPAVSAALLMLSVVVIVSTGCTRRFYRIQADDEAYMLMDTVASHPRWTLDRINVYADPRSRMFDPFSQDRPPMPPDDPTAHRLMYYVDGMRGWRGWDRNGDIPEWALQGPNWGASLPQDEEGNVVLDLVGAVEVARLNSRELQSNFEELYLSALDVSFERFRFDSQFFGGNSTFFTADGRVRGGGMASSQLRTDSGLEMQRMFAPGGELIVGFANSFVWQFAGTNNYRTNSLLNLSFVQPLLRGGGRARVLETLTISERALLANVRQMARFERGFYLQVATGGDAGPGPQRRGGLFGGAGLSGFTGVGGGGFGRVGGFGNFGGGGGTGAAQAGGYMGLLQQAQEIENLAANVVALRDSLAQLEAQYDAGRIDRFQVDQNRAALYSRESQLLNQRAAYESQVDAFLVELGLPPDLPLKVVDPMLDRFHLIDPAMTEFRDTLADLLDAWRSTPVDDVARQADAWLADVRAARSDTLAHVDVVREDLTRFEENRAERVSNLRDLGTRPDLAAAESEAFSVQAFEERAVGFYNDFDALLKHLDASLAALDSIEQVRPENPEALRRVLVSTMTELSGQLLELSLIQARVRLESIVLVPVDLEAADALEIARNNRLDWMNARSSLVDTWRLIQFNANNLMSDLDVVFNGDIGTTADNPFGFRDSNGRLEVGLEWDAPLTRVAERNNYRQSLIEYAQARRNYVRYVDEVNQGLRATLRTVRLNQMNVELRRAAVLVAISQVELARLRLSEPPKPDAQPRLSSTTARDLVDALAGLNGDQDAFLSVWVNYEVLRQSLDFNLGTMVLDDRGVWVDPGPIRLSAPLEDSEPREMIPPGAPSDPNWLVPEQLPPPEAFLPGDGRVAEVDGGPRAEHSDGRGMATEPRQSIYGLPVARRHRPVSPDEAPDRPAVTPASATNRMPAARK